VPVTTTTALAASRLGDEEHRLLRGWAASAGAEPGGPRILIDRLGALGARRALELVRGGEGGTPAALSSALARRSGLAELRAVVESLFVRRADVLRTRSVLTGLEAVVRLAPPGGEGARQLRFELERVRSGAHELREIELLDVLQSGDLPLPDEVRRAAQRLLGGNGRDMRARLGLTSDATIEQLRAEAARQPARWRELAMHPSTRVREAAQLLVRTSEELVVQVCALPTPPERSATHERGATVQR
jgi:hypothetical protein